MWKVKIITALSSPELEKRVNEFISTIQELKDISHAMAPAVLYSALIIYK